MNEIALIVITALVTSGLSTIFSYYKEKKFASAKYTEKVLVDLYIPIYKYLSKTPDPTTGYEGINEAQFNFILKIVEDNPELIDPRLNKYVYSIKEDIYINSYNNQDYEDYRQDYIMYDSDGEMFDYVLKAFNITRKSLGLPYNKRYASIWAFVYKLNEKINLKRRIRRMKRRFKIK